MHKLYPPRIIHIVVLIAMTLFLINMLKAPPKIQASTAKVPVIIIPGFSGTSLQAPDIGTYIEEVPDGHGGTYSHIYSPFEEVWVNRLQAALPGYDDYFDVLGLQPDGQTPRARLALKELIPEVYQPTINYFVSKGYVRERDLYSFTYDWRMDIRDNNERLSEMIDNAKARTGQTKVNIIAHSMGGLLLRNYIADPQKAANINSAVTLGTPFLGAPEILKWLKYGGCLKFPLGSSCLSLAASETKDIIQNLPSVYQLLPTKKYYDIYNNQDSSRPYPYKDTSDSDADGINTPLNYTQLKSLLSTLGYNTSLFTQAEQLHELIDTPIPTLPNGTFNIIVGSGKPTLGQMEEKNVLTVGNIQLNKKDAFIINGDNSVPLYSAMLQDSQKNVNLSGSAKLFFVNQDHSKLPADPFVLNFINYLFNGSASGSYDYNGIKTSPFPLKGHLISVHSPVKLDVYNESGYHIGLNDYGEIDNEVDNAIYDELDDAKFVWLPRDGKYTINVKATGEGSFDLKIRDYESERITKEIDYENIPLTLDTSGTIELNTVSSAPPTLQLDSTGDGLFDSNILPTHTIEEDRTPPSTQTKLTGKLGEMWWYSSDVELTLTATDNPNGSGVERTTYSLDFTDPIPYTHPVTISKEGFTRLQFFSVDNKGNTEITHTMQIKIDKTAPEAQFIFNPKTQNIELTGIDNLTGVEITEIGEGKALIQDFARNTTTISYSPKDKKKKDKMTIETIQYQNNQPITLPKNELKVDFKIDQKTSTTKELKQKLTLKNDLKIETEYDNVANKTKVEQKIDDSQKEKYQIDGLGIIKLFTSKGALTSEVSL